MEASTFLPQLLLAIIHYQWITKSWKTNPDLKARRTQQTFPNTMTQKNLPLTLMTGAFPDR